jgi:hypothetical protein
MASNPFQHRDLLKVAGAAGTSALAAGVTARSEAQT